MAATKAESPADPAVPIASLSFEEALAELERIVRGLESGSQKLEDAIAAYERGAALKRHCDARLAEAETRVHAIVAGPDGTLSLKDAP
jgi:exodeoxyribonuclease VII small subunit